MAGLPHSEIRGSKGARPSPRLIAACYVLHRLSVPRHPPNALIALDRSKPKTSRLTTGPLKTDRHPQRPINLGLETLLSSSSHSFEATNASATVLSWDPALKGAKPTPRTLATRKDPVFVRSFRSLIHNDKQPCQPDDLFGTRRASRARPSGKPFTDGTRFGLSNPSPVKSAWWS
jgi:hypothetical protein